MKKGLFILFLFFSVAISAQQIKPVKITEIEKIIKESKTPLIINFWATWCVPCIEEIPYFIEEIKKHEKDSIRLLLVSLDFREDFPNKVNSFVNKRKFNATIFWLDETKADYFCPKIDKTWSGAIPATLCINNKKGYRKFFENQISPDELKKEIRAFL